MAFLADLLGKTDPTLALLLTEKLEARGLSGVSHASELFSRVKAKVVPEAEREEIRGVLDDFFSNYGVGAEVVMKQWRTLMQYWAGRVAFVGGSLSEGECRLDKLDELVAAIEHGSSSTHNDVKDAAMFLIKVAQREIL